MISNGERQGERGPARRPLLNRLILAGLRSPLHRLFDGGTIGLRYSSNSGHEIILPVAYVRSGSDLVVLVGDSAEKTWWRHFLAREMVDILWQGAWRSTTAQVFAPGTGNYLGAAIAYRTQHPRVKSSRDPFLRVAIPSKLDVASPLPGPNPMRPSAVRPPPTVLGDSPCWVSPNPR